jgi:hypothetical protein
VPYFSGHFYRLRPEVCFTFSEVENGYYATHLSLYLVLLKNITKVHNIIGLNTFAKGVFLAFRTSRGRI